MHLCEEEIVAFTVYVNSRCYPILHYQAHILKSSLYVLSTFTRCSSPTHTIHIIRLLDCSLHDLSSTRIPKLRPAHALQALQQLPQRIRRLSLHLTPIQHFVLDLLAGIGALACAGGYRAHAVGDDGGLDLAGVGVPGDDAEGGLGVVGEGEGGVFCWRGKGVSADEVVDGGVMSRTRRGERGEVRGRKKWERTFDQGDEIADREVVALRHGDSVVVVVSCVFGLLC